MAEIPPSIVVEDTAYGVRYVLPKRDAAARAMSLVVFGTVFGGLALFWMAIVLVITFGGNAGGFFQFCFPAFGLPFLAIGLGMFAYGMNQARGQATIEVTADTLSVTDGWGPFRRKREHPKAKIAELSVRSNHGTQSSGCMIAAKITDGGWFRFAKGYSQALLVPVAESLLKHLEIASALHVSEGGEPQVSVVITSAGIPHVPDPRPRDVILSSAAGSLGGIALLVIGVIWSAFVSIFAAIWYFNEGFDGWMLLFLGIFGGVGLLMLAGGIHKVLAQSRMHPPVVSLSTAPVLIGESVTAYFAQTPKRGVQINRIKVKVVCRESATYTHGTNTSTVTHDVSTQEFTLLENVHASPLQPLEGEFPIAVPDDAMHSFSGTHNKIEWIIESHTDIAGWPDYKHGLTFDVAAQRVQLADQTANASNRS